MVMYISWLDCHPDKMEVVGSSPTITTKYFIKGVNGLDGNAFGKGQAVGIHLKQQKNINAENVDSPAYEYAMAA